MRLGPTGGRSPTSLAELTTRREPHRVEVRLQLPRVDGLPCRVQAVGLRREHVVQHVLWAPADASARARVEPDAPHSNTPRYTPRGVHVFLFGFRRLCRAGGHICRCPMSPELEFLLEIAHLPFYFSRESRRLASSVGRGGHPKRERVVSQPSYVSISRLRGAGIEELAQVQPYASYGYGAISAQPSLTESSQTLHRVIHTVAHAASIELLETACSTWCSRSGSGGARNPPLAPGLECLLGLAAAGLVVVGRGLRRSWSCLTLSGRVRHGTAPMPRSTWRKLTVRCSGDG